MTTIILHEPKMPTLGFGGGAEALNESMQYTIFMLAQKLKEFSEKGTHGWSTEDIKKIENMRHYMLHDLPVKHLSR